MTKAEEALQRELGTIRAGVANASLLNRVNVEYYGVPTPLNQMAQISVPEARVLLITPYDKSSLKDIEHALLASDLGIAPMNDGSAIRLVIPQLTEERRKELAKQVKATSEKGKVAVRNVRREMMDALKKAQKNGDLTEDQLRDLEDVAQKVTDNSIKNIENITAEKRKRSACRLGESFILLIITGQGLVETGAYWIDEFVPLFFNRGEDMFSNLFKNKQAAQNKLDQKRIPAHVAIIMDGNGRWAKARLAPSCRAQAGNGDGQNDH